MTNVFFIGIGGSGMFPLARLAAQMGYRVSGQDDRIDPKKRKGLVEAGVILYESRDPHHLDDIDLVVYSSAIPFDHPYLRAASEQEEGPRLLHRMDFLNELVRGCPLQFAVGGTHGKTSTSSMFGYLLVKLGLDPLILVGGKPLYLDDGVQKGGGEIAVFETDESDGSFLKTTAPFRICLNVDTDHLNYYGNFDALKKAFHDFIFDAEVSVLNGNDPTLFALSEELLEQGRDAVYVMTGTELPRSVFPFPLYRGRFIDESEVMRVERIENGTTEELGELLLEHCCGRHFVRNALQICALLDHLIRTDRFPHRTAVQILDALKGFPGVERRIEKIGSFHGATVYDDYGHHPTEIEAVLSALRGRVADGKKLIALFQPHRYSRTKEGYREFAASLCNADRVYLLPIYSAGEAPLEGVSSALIAEQEPGLFRIVNDDELDVPFESLDDGDILLCIGAGDISLKVRSFLGAIR